MSEATSEATHTDIVLTDDWSVPKLIGLVVLVLGVFFVFIYSVSPYEGLGTPAAAAVK